MKAIARSIEEWYLQNKRDLPWRANSSPYEIWISEIILQQTRVNQGLQYFHRFLERFPTIFHLAEASIEEVLKVWQGLGYYTRARNLHLTAGYIVGHWQGKFPSDYNELLALKGIGEYTAAAIASIAFNIPVALVDGNVIRVIARLYGIDTPISSAETRKEIKRLAGALLNIRNPGIHNQAMMELGALVCLPGNPSCDVCPLADKCLACKQNLVHAIPHRSLARKTKKRYFHYLYILYGQKTFIHQRKQKDIWHSLFEFPLIETKGPLKASAISSHKSWSALLQDCKPNLLHASSLFRHQLTHQTLHVRFYKIIIDKVTPDLSEKYTCIDQKDLYNYPVARITEKYLESIQ
jgi:A/G-specific adenine glycosylase